MGFQTVWLPTALYTALIRLQLDDFTTIGCVNAIFGGKAQPQVHRRRYGIFYRHLLKLVRLGLLERKHIGDGRVLSHFSKTPKFDEVIFLEDFTALDAPVTAVDKEADERSSGSVLESLDARARRYRLTLQEYDSALAEYNELRSDFPMLDPAIDKAMSNVFDECRDLRGRLTAVENILQVFGSAP